MFLDTEPALSERDSKEGSVTDMQIRSQESVK